MFLNGWNERGQLSCSSLESRSASHGLLLGSNRGVAINNLKSVNRFLEGVVWGVPNIVLTIFESLSEVSPFELENRLGLLFLLLLHGLLGFL